MNTIDWLIMLGTILFIVLYGMYKTRRNQNLDSFLKGNSENKWWVVCISVMATQASAITFLSVPGQAYADGLGFIQFYFGLPIAMVIICIFFIPMYYKLKVYTAYEYLENRFDVKTRTLTAFLFLIQRAFSTGITLYAPSIILSQLLGWSLHFTVLFIGILVTLYIANGGSKAISVTHKQQMLVIYLGMFTAFGYLIYYLSEYVNFSESLQIAGVLGKMHIISDGIDENGNFNWGNRYNIISGIIGGLFLQLSYFGTDQSQVGRYLTGENARESKLGLIFNGLLKIPVQLFILLIGVLLFVFYQFNQPPVYFNEVAYEQTQNSVYADSLKGLESQLKTNILLKEEELDAFTDQFQKHDADGMELASADLKEVYVGERAVKDSINKLITAVNPKISSDNDYVFMHFVMNYLPVGIVGLLFAVIFCASMGATSSALNALSATFSVDVYKRFINRQISETKHLFISKLSTILFGAFAIGFALICSLFDNLIEAVNILGSLFYGTILGIFLTAFILKKVKGNAVFIAAVITQLFIFYIDFSVRFDWNTPTIEVGYLWYNVIACILLMLLAFFITMVTKTKKPDQSIGLV
ncbi:MAG: sodium:solute symporter [Chitinophagales bacterium]